ncbi:HDL435Wp [Eremothecium sinecaudum]|uniref:HDL435Wp n=1 Tax=Eremothecium sinecaudum TaxID=45286 RepID=A0A0X8HRU5_9SACH|nr:HDL435Wp [Eremothecium sinecaudum]AMD20309.1 HDL435Wp [Eremothecium sinecaudum]
MSAENFYRMMILLEEPLPDSGSDSKRQNATHDFVDELVLPIQVDELDLLNTWFDKFDEQISIPNEGLLKYEISSDGLIVLILDKKISHVVEDVKKFLHENPINNEEE